ncbi:hypothetical protein DRQ53_13665 [bacterium]|nr:MAG: hypothetical protein DRQ53_13665 [bacterium]
MTLTLVRSYPDPAVSIDPGGSMALTDRWHWDSADGSIYIDANGEGHGPPLIQGSDNILEMQTLALVGDAPNDLLNVTFSGKLRASKKDPVIQAEFTFMLVPDSNNEIVQLRLSAAASALMTSPTGVWDAEARWFDDSIQDIRVRRFVEGRYLLSLEVDH